MDEILEHRVIYHRLYGMEEADAIELAAAEQRDQTHGWQMHVVGYESAKIWAEFTKWQQPLVAAVAELAEAFEKNWPLEEHSKAWAIVWLVTLLTVLVGVLL